jgi:hypothetical protein
MKTREIIFWILVLISLAIAGWYLFGNSPTFEQTILVLILTITFGIGTKVAMIGEKINLIEKRFNFLANDFKKHINKK